MSLGSAIEQHRTSRGFSKRKLALLTGYSRAAIISWERGDYRPRPVAIKRLEAALGLEAGSLNE